MTYTALYKPILNCNRGLVIFKLVQCPPTPLPPLSIPSPFIFNNNCDALYKINDLLYPPNSQSFAKIYTMYSFEVVDFKSLINDKL